MGEKHYRPIIKDGDHLVQSKKNSNRVIGQTRNAENKNPDIIEWEEVEDTDYDAQLDSLIKKYPALMDDSTTENIAALLRMNSDSRENKRIKEVLKID